MSDDRRIILEQRAALLIDLKVTTDKRRAQTAELAALDTKLMLMKAEKTTSSTKSPGLNTEPLQSDPFDHESEQLFFFDDQMGSAFRLGRKPNGDIIGEGTMPPLPPGWEFTTFQVKGTGIEAQGERIHHPPKKLGTSAIHLTCILDKKAKESFNFPFFVQACPDEDYLPALLQSSGSSSGLLIFGTAQGDVEIQMISTSGQGRVLITIPEEKTVGLIRGVPKKEAFVAESPEETSQAERIVLPPGTDKGLFSE